MSLTVVILAAAAVAVIALFSTTVHPTLRPATVGSPAGNTVVGLGDPAAETKAGGLRRVPVVSDWQLATVSDLTVAEELLDCLEAQGFEERELIVMGNSSFGVRWR